MCISTGCPGCRALLQIWSYCFNHNDTFFRFLSVYVNHRPAFGLSPDKLLWAFKTVAESPEMDKGGLIERGDFLNLLQKNG